MNATRPGSSGLPPSTPSSAAPAWHDASLGAMFFARARHSDGGSSPAIRRKRDGAWVSISFGALADSVEQFAAGLLDVTAASGGLDHGAAVSIVADTRLEWIVADFALLSLGAVVVPIYGTLTAAEVAFIHQDAGATVAVVENKLQLDKLRATRGGCVFLGQELAPSALRHIVVLDASGIEPASDWVSYDDLMARGRVALERTRAVREQRLAATTRSDTATLCYTSGTTGAPKGVSQSHGNWLFILDHVGELDLFTLATRQTGALLFLPLAHAFGRLISFGCVYFQTPVHLSSIPTLGEDLVATRPGFVPAAPRMFEKMYNRITAAVSTAPPHRQQLFRWAMGVGKQRIAHWQAGTPLPLPLRAQVAVADRLVFSKLRARLGLDRCSALTSGSAPLAPSVQEFFLSLGLLLLEGYGLTETTALVSVNRPGRFKPGTVGPLLTGCRVRIAADGEILVRGDNLTRGYHKRDDANREAFDAEGWFHTGDVGEIDPQGFLRITDRKKDLLKTSGGKYIAPVKLEGMLKAQPLITEAVVIGDNRAFCTALLVVDPEDLRTWATATGHPADLQGKALHAVLQQGIDAVNAQLAPFETLKAFRVVDEPFSVDNGLLTGSFKVKRKAVAERFAPLIEAMYGAASTAKRDSAA